MHESDNFSIYNAEAALLYFLFDSMTIYSPRQECFPPDSIHWQIVLCSTFWKRGYFDQAAKINIQAYLKTNANHLLTVIVSHQYSEHIVFGVHKEM